MNSVEAEGRPLSFYAIKNKNPDDCNCKHRGLSLTNQRGLA